MAANLVLVVSDTLSNSKSCSTLYGHEDFGFYGNNDVEGLRLNRNSQSVTSAGGNVNTSTPSAWSNSSGLVKYGSGEQVSPSDFSPGLLDHYCSDTVLLTEVHSENNLNLLNQPLCAKGLDDANAHSLARKFANLSCGLSENNTLKSSLADKEKGGNVAKIKVVETAKMEEDIITIDPNANSLTVHEAKVKVDLTEYVEKHGFIFDAVMNEDVTNDEAGNFARGMLENSRFASWVCKNTWYQMLKQCWN